MKLFSHILIVSSTKPSLLFGDCNDDTNSRWDYSIQVKLRLTKFYS